MLNAIELTCLYQERKTEIHRMSQEELVLFESCSDAHARKVRRYEAWRTRFSKVVGGGQLQPHALPNPGNNIDFRRLCRGREIFGSIVGWQANAGYRRDVEYFKNYLQNNMRQDARVWTALQANIASNLLLAQEAALWSAHFGWRAASLLTAATAGQYFKVSAMAAKLTGLKAATVVGPLMMSLTGIGGVALGTLCVVEGARFYNRNLASQSAARHVARAVRASIRQHDRPLPDQAGAGPAPEEHAAMDRALRLPGVLDLLSLADLANLARLAPWLRDVMNRDGVNWPTRLARMAHVDRQALPPPVAPMSFQTVARGYVGYVGSLCGSKFAARHDEDIAHFVGYMLNQSPQLVDAVNGVQNQVHGLRREGRQQADAIYREAISNLKIKGSARLMAMVESMVLGYVNHQLFRSIGISSTSFWTRCCFPNRNPGLLFMGFNGNNFEALDQDLYEVDVDFVKVFSGIVVKELVGGQEIEAAAAVAKVKSFNVWLDGIPSLAALFATGQSLYRYGRLLSASEQGEKVRIEAAYHAFRRQIA